MKKGIENMMQVGLAFGALLEHILVDFADDFNKILRNFVSSYNF